MMKAIMVLLLGLVLCFIPLFTINIIGFIGAVGCVLGTIICIITAMKIEVDEEFNKGH